MTEQQRRVLIVDDDPDIRDILTTALREKNLATDEAMDGAQALALLRENRYAVVLLDLQMPGIDGFGVLEAIDPSEADAPVVLVVSGAGRSVIDRVNSAKIHGVVKKPFDPFEIADVVAACAGSKGRSSFETMAYATLIGSAPLIALLKW